MDAQINSSRRKHLKIKDVCCETNLMVDHKDCTYLSLCKTFGSVLMRVNNRWMGTISFNTSHPGNEYGSTWSYLAAYSDRLLLILIITRMIEMINKKNNYIRNSNSNENIIHCNITNHRISLTEKGQNKDKSMNWTDKLPKYIYCDNIVFIFVFVHIRDRDKYFLCFCWRSNNTLYNKNSSHDRDGNAIEDVFGN
ncbi:hypothetical protein RFI_05218 [Reticulomyxa filosa]|uniref:Uncharacterized protein n=1 Tax=Reticulomyxa filosa TaxID=46433 RepID=X6P1G2_RETFI|nr:hypothetical protein RFI_05218 [Reticulomyxa filosa]|eukprot:ETO31899.1 hypothetical protein RFI_05218 [Reticulomyxa filosa]